MLHKKLSGLQILKSQRKNRDRKSAGRELKPLDGAYAHICSYVWVVLGMFVVLLMDLQDTWQRSENLLGYISMLTALNSHSLVM